MKTDTTHKDGRDGTMDWFYNALDDAMLEGNFTFVADCLRFTDVQYTPTDILLVLLVTSGWCKNQPDVIEIRRKFVVDCENEFNRRCPEETEGLMVGLR